MIKVNELAVGAPNLLGQVYLACRLGGNTHEGSLNVADEAVKVFGVDSVPEADLSLILENIVVG